MSELSCEEAAQEIAVLDLCLCSVWCSLCLLEHHQRLVLAKLAQHIALQGDISSPVLVVVPRLHLILTLALWLEPPCLVVGFRDCI